MGITLPGRPVVLTDFDGTRYTLHFQGSINPASQVLSPGADYARAFAGGMYGIDVTLGPLSRALQSSTLLLTRGITTLPAGQSGLAYLDNATGLYALPDQYSAFVGNGGDTTLFANNGSNQSVLSAGALFFGASGSGTVVAGDSNNQILVTGSAGPWAVHLGLGNNTVVASSGDDEITAGNGRNLFYLGSGQSYLFAAGTDTVVGGSGTSTIVSGSIGTPTINPTVPGKLVFAGSGGLTFIGEAGISTVAGLASSITVTGAAGGLFFGGTAGHNHITAGTGLPQSRSASDTGAATIYGGGDGDVLQAGGAGTDLIGGGSGAETISGLGTSGTNTFYAGTGADLIIGGSGTTAFAAGQGNDTLIAGSGLNLFVFSNGRAGGTDLIQGFNPGRDFIALQGYAPGTAGSVLANATVSNGSERLTLPDGTRIDFLGVTSLPSSVFI